jgi:hypothetical protein
LRTCRSCEMWPSRTSSPEGEHGLTSALQRTRPLLRLWMNLKVLVWGLAAEGGRYCDTRSQVVLLNVNRM